MHVEARAYSEFEFSSWNSLFHGRGDDGGGIRAVANRCHRRREGQIVALR